MTSPAITRVANLGNLPLLVREMAGALGLRRILTDQDLSPTVLEDPNNLILSRDVLGLYQRAAEVTGLSDFGLRVGGMMTPHDLELYGEFILSAPTLYSALSRTVSGIQFHESQSAFSVELRQDEVVFSYENTQQGVLGWRHMADCILCVMNGIVRHYVDTNGLLERIEVDHSRVRPSPDIEDHFEIPVVYDQSSWALIYDRDVLSLPTAADARSTRNVTIRDLADLSKPLPPRFPDAVAMVAHQRLLDGQTSIEGLGSKMVLTERTLQRRLAEFGTTYQKIIDKVRFQRTLNLMTVSGLSLNEIADRLGYASQSQFSRAFKRWTGYSPGRFRAVKSKFAHAPR